MKTKKKYLVTAKEYKRTKHGFVSVAYSSQKTNSKKRGHSLPSYTKDELREWLYSQPLFHVLYDNWKRLDFQKEYKPSIDRKDDHIGYTMGNIQLMTWGENRVKGVRTRVDKCVAVIKCTREGIFLEEYQSIHEAGRENNASYQNIHKCCNYRRSHAGGFVWKYK